MQELPENAKGNIVGYLPTRSHNALNLFMTSTALNKSPAVMEKVKKFKIQRAKDLLHDYSNEDSGAHRDELWARLTRHYTDVLNDMVSDGRKNAAKQEPLDPRFETLKRTLSYIYSSYDAILDDSEFRLLKKMAEDNAGALFVKTYFLSEVNTAIKNVLHATVNKINYYLEEFELDSANEFMEAIPDFLTALYKYKKGLGENVNDFHRDIKHVMERFCFVIANWMEHLKVRVGYTMHKNNIDGLFNPYIAELQIPALADGGRRQPKRASQSRRPPKKAAVRRK